MESESVDRTHGVLRIRDWRRPISFASAGNVLISRSRSSSSRRGRIAIRVCTVHVQLFTARMAFFPVDIATGWGLLDDDSDVLDAWAQSQRNGLLSVALQIS